MKWLFFALLLVNVGGAVFQWVKQRDSEVVPRFEQDSSVKVIQLLSDGVGEGLKNGGLADRRCVLVGPVEEREVLVSALRKVDVDHNEVRVVEQPIELAPSYWVYVEQEDGGALKKTLEELRIDYYQVRVGELKGNLSLGVFENIDLARGLVKKVEQNGVMAKIHEKKKKDFSFWLEYAVDYAAENQEKIAEIQGFLPFEQKKREFFCKSVASGK